MPSSGRAGSAHEGRGASLAQEEYRIASARPARRRREDRLHSLLVTRRLPFFNRVYRVDKHQDIQGEVISDQDC